MTFVCCVESGGLEAQTVRMVKSLRLHGGRFADAPVVAVTPRFGPPLSKNTVETFRSLNVIYIRRPRNNPCPWFKFLNKPLALVQAEEIISSEAICFLDSDLLIVKEPDQLCLLPTEDFLAFPVETKEMGTSGPGDPYEPLWQEFCRVVGIGIDDLPWVNTAETNERVRLYFNSGVFVYRRSSGFGKSYLDICLQLLNSRISTRAEGYGEGLREMIGLGFSVVKLGLRWRALPYSHNYVMTSMTHDAWYKEELLREAKIVHYHDAMWPRFYPVFQKCMRSTHPEVEGWLSPLGPLHNYAPSHWRLLSRILNDTRSRHAMAYRRSCSFV
jgi:hypothetical protein